MSDELKEILTQRNALVYVATTGAGLSFQYNLWKKPGCSKYLVGFFTPYAKGELQEFIGYEPDGSFVSKEVAYDLAMASYIRATKHKFQESIIGAWRESFSNPIGIGITAAVATNRIPKGEQRAFICVISKHRVLLKEVKLVKELGETFREAHDQLIAAEAEMILTSAITLENCHLYVDGTYEALDRFYKYPTFKLNSRSAESLGTALYLPASLNPVHSGHREMANLAENKLSTPFGKVSCKYLISTSSPHKGDLSLQEILYKAGMLRAEATKALYPNQVFREFEFTKDEPLYLDKARKRPGSIFVIGTDTMERFLDPKWGPDPVEMLCELKELNTKFFVMGRKTTDGVFQTVNDIPVPDGYNDLFVHLEGRVDISSTQLREQGDGFKR